MKALFFGTANADISAVPVEHLDPAVDSTYVDDITLTSGGNGMSASIVAKRLGVDSSLAAYIGDESDLFSNFLLDTLKKNGVDTRLVHRVPNESCGMVIALISERGSRYFLLKSGAQQYLNITPELVERLDEFDVVSIHGTFQMPSFDGKGTYELLSRAKALGKTTLMDVTPSGTGDWISLIADALKYCDYFMPSILEAQKMSRFERVEDIAEDILTRGPKCVIIKHGSKGCYYSNGTESGFVPAYKIKAVDTTGAGDCFCAAFVSTLEREIPLVERLKYASAVGAICCTSMGAISGIKDKAQVEEFIKQHEV